MKPNLLIYLFKQCVFKTVEGTILGTASFSVVAIGAFFLAQEFPPISASELTPQNFLSVLFTVALFVCFIIAGGVVLALGLYWYFGRGKFSNREIISIATLVSLLTWMAFFILVVAPVTWATWRDFFTRHNILASFFDIFSFSVSIGSGLWVGWRLTKEFEEQKARFSDLFVLRWQVDSWRTHLHLFWQGGGLGVLCAILASFIFGLIFELSFLLLFGLKLEIHTYLLFAGLGSMFSSIPALFGGYGIAQVLYVEKLNGVLTKKSAFWQSAMLAALAGFGICVVIGGLYLTNPHSTSILVATPEILGITFLAGIMGGTAGILLHTHI
jgi:MFS family permease